MKTPILIALLAVALAANAWLLRPRAALPPPPVAMAPAASTASAAPVAITWSALAQDKPADLAAKLRAAALPPHLQRALVAAQIEEEFRVREEALRGPRKKLKYWQTEPPLSLATRKALAELRREKSRLRVALLGADPADVADETNPLPPEKRTAARLINEDYAAILKELRDLAGTRGTLLPSERAQLTALENEQRRELAALLSPAELAEFDARFSPASAQVRYAIFGMNPTEEEFRKILAAQQGIEAEMRGTDRPVAQWVDFFNREELRTKLDAAVKAAVGDARFADYKRAQDGEFQQLARFTLRGGNALDGAVSAWGVRSEAAVESRRIADDKALSDEQKGAALQALATKTREQFGAAVGPAAAAAYLQSPSASWFAYIDKGWAVTIRDRGMSMSPVSPAAKASQVRPPAAAPPPRP
jgi:hypothetical protein